MKPWFWILCGAIVLGLGAPEIKLEDRRPAAVLYVCRGESGITAETDLGDRGCGRNLQEALRDLQERAPGNVLLETLQNLIVDRETLGILEEAKGLLHPEIRVCASQGRISPEQAMAYLKIHGEGKTILDLRQREWGLPVLIGEGEGYVWQKSD